MSKSKPPLILELKLSSSIQNSHRQQLKMYLVSVKRKPKSVVAKTPPEVVANVHSAVVMLVPSASQFLFKAL